jgi:hypothetical protein
MTRKLLILFLLTPLMLTAAPMSATGFSTSDMSGYWYIYSIEVDTAIPAVYWIRGYIQVNAAGNILSGAYYGPDNSEVALTGGQIRVNLQGIISGSFTAQGQTGTVVHGKLDQSKTIGSAVLIGVDNTLDMITFIKSGGSFNTSDLEGKWHIYVTIIDPATGAVFWLRGTYTCDALGRVTTGYMTGPDGFTLTVESGNLFMNSAGIVTGNVALSNGQKFSIAQGKIDQGKTRGLGVSIEPDGSMGVAYMVKGGGAFDPTDIASASFAYGLIIDPSIPAVYWAYGDIKISKTGNYNGSYKAPTGATAFSTGTVAMDTLGVITGTTNFDTGDTGVAYFKEDQGKTSRVGVSVTTGGTMGIWQFYEASPITLPGVQMLLLNQ